MNKKKYVDIRKINLPIARSGFKYKVSVGRKLLACGCVIFSFVVPDLSIGFILGVCLLSPIGLKRSLSHKVSSGKDWVVSKYYKIRLRL